ncbi:glycosyltransferase [Viscerimonas tarda]
MNFSVLLSIYCKENPLFLQKALDSVFNQTVPPAEVVLVKDGPLTPDLDRIIDAYQKNYPILKVISLPLNKGLGNALNEGIKHCSYEWIARMDTDDICYPYRFEKQLDIIRNQPDISFISSGIAEFIDTPDNIRSYRNLPEKHNEIYLYAKKRCPVNHPATMYRKQAVIDAGGYKEFPEDYHLWIRALMKGYKFYNIQEPLLYFRTNLDTIKRRGGWKYGIIELRHQYDFYKIGFLTFPQFVYNCAVRFVVRLIPPVLRQRVYNKLLGTRILPPPHKHLLINNYINKPPSSP